jgi:hypothetical protein
VRDGRGECEKAVWKGYGRIKRVREGGDDQYKKVSRTGGANVRKGKEGGWLNHKLIGALNLALKNDRVRLV